MRTATAKKRWRGFDEISARTTWCSVLTFRSAADRSGSIFACRTRRQARRKPPVPRQGAKHTSMTWSAVPLRPCVGDSARENSARRYRQRSEPPCHRIPKRRDCTRRDWRSCGCSTPSAHGKCSGELLRQTRTTRWPTRRWPLPGPRSSTAERHRRKPRKPWTFRRTSPGKSASGWKAATARQLMSGTKRSTSIIRCGGFFPTISIMACVLPTRRQEGARAKTPWQQRKRSVTFHHHNVMTRESTSQKRRRPTPSETTGEHSKRRREHLSRAKRWKPSSWWPRPGSRKEERLLPSGSRGTPAPLKIGRAHV